MDDLSLTSRLSKELLDNNSRLGEDYLAVAAKPPPGLYLCAPVASPNHPRLKQMFGIYFVREGVYKGAIVKFIITVAEEYPLLMTPLISVVSPAEIVLDGISTPDNSEFPILGPIDSWWAPGRHTLLTILEYIVKSLHDYVPVGEENEYLVEECIEQSKETASSKLDPSDVFYMEGGSFTWQLEEIREKITNPPTS